MKFTKVQFNSHKSHNPYTDILEGWLSNDGPFITYAINVKGDKVGEESMEFYQGENYGGTGRSYSRHFTPDKIPAKFKSAWQELKSMYEKKYKSKSVGESKTTTLSNIFKEVVREAKVRKGLNGRKKHNYFYKITNLVNGKYYYGIHSTNNLEDGYMGSGHTLLKAVKKYGKENFTKKIIADYPTRKEASDHEKLVVNMELVISEDCYNLRTGGDNECVQLVSEDTKRKHRERIRNKHSEISKAKISASNTGKTHTPQAIIKIKEAKSNIKDETRVKIGQLKKGNSYRKGKLHTDTTKKTISEKLTGSNNVKSIGCVINGVVYSSYRQAAIVLGVDHKTIMRRVNSKKEVWSEWCCENTREYVN